MTKARGMTLVRKRDGAHCLAAGGRRQPRQVRSGKATRHQIDGSAPPLLDALPNVAAGDILPLPKSESALAPGALYRLMTWLSPAYPVGAFSYSSGIEWAVEAGDVNDAATLRSWLEVMLRTGAGLNDGIFFSHAHRAVTCGDDAALAEIAALAAAFVPTRERYQETTTLGRAFIEVTRAAWPCRPLTRMQGLWHGPIAYPIAVALACAGHAIPLEPALLAFLTAIAANWLSAGVRLIPLGHTDGQRLLQALEPALATAERRALAARLDDIGGATFRADIASARHETQYTRLFRS